VCVENWDASLEYKETATGLPSILNAY
jgi:hypothetical protein